MAKASHGINPVTFEGSTYRDGSKDLRLTVLRAHLEIGGKLFKLLNLLVWRDPGVEEPSAEQVEKSRVANLFIDEDHFLGGMYHLFPQGTLDYCDETVPKTYSGLVEALQAAQTELQALGGSPETLGKVAQALQAAGK